MQKGSDCSKLFLKTKIRLNKTVHRKKPRHNWTFRLPDTAPTRGCRNHSQSPSSSPSPVSFSEAPTHHADPEVHMGGCDQGGEDGEHRFLRPAQQPGDGCVDHQRQREEEPVETLRPGAAHLADDHLALWEQKGTGWEALGQPGGSWQKCVHFLHGLLSVRGKQGWRSKWGWFLVRRLLLLHLPALLPVSLKGLYYK